MIKIVATRCQILRLFYPHQVGSRDKVPDQQVWGRSTLELDGICTSVWYFTTILKIQ